MRSVETVLFLVVVAAVVAAFARRLAVPAPSLLVVAGLLIRSLDRLEASISGSVPIICSRSS